MLIYYERWGYMPPSVPSPAATRRSFSSCISRAGGGVGLPMLTMPHIPERSCPWNHTCYLHFPSSWLPGPSAAKVNGVSVMSVAVQHILLPHGEVSCVHIPSSLLSPVQPKIKVLRLPAPYISFLHAAVAILHTSPALHAAHQHARCRCGDGAHRLWLRKAPALITSSFSLSPPFRPPRTRSNPCRTGTIDA
jgi:hypothetical protein